MLARALHRSERERESEKEGGKSKVVLSKVGHLARVH
jgi:hypothetical protein